MNSPNLDLLKQLAPHLQSWGERLPVVVATLLVVALAQGLAQLTWRVVPAPESEPVPPPPVSVVRPASSREQDWSQHLLQAHLFGRPPRETAPPPQTPIEAPETALKLTLRGVYLADDHRASHAIIADASGRDETYGPGDPLPGGATLEEIYVDRVILKRNGRLETLRLPREADQGAHRRLSGSARGRSTARGSVSVPPDAGRVLARYRERLLNDPQSVMDVVRAEPYRRGGRIVGYRVFPGRDRGLLSQVGLQPGDVITEVNGMGLDNPLNGLEIMRDLQNASAVRVKVLRNGVEQELSVALP